MATLEVKVKGDEFNPSSQDGANGDTVKFINKRDESVTIDLNLTPGFYSQTSLALSANGEGSVTITGTSGAGEFKAPKKDSRKRDEGNIKGDVKINTSR